MRKGSKIAFVMPWHISERGGGAEVQANYLAQELGQRGFSVTYICQTRVPDRVDTEELIGCVKVCYLKASGRFQWQDQNKYLTPLKNFEPDYILQRLSSNVIYVLGKYRKTHNCQLIWFCTDNKSPFSDLYTTKFKKQSETKRLGFIKHIIFALNSKLMDYFRNKGMKLVDVAFSQNSFQKEHIKKSFGLDSLHMISGHPIPDHQIPTSNRFDQKVILWCANFGAHKRPELFIELASKMQHTNLKFIMVGGHSNQNYVETLLKNKPENLTVTGKLSFTEALSYFDRSTLFVNTSTSGGDGFPNTFIQSWLRSVPVVTFGFDPDGMISKNKLGYNVNSLNDGSSKIEELCIDYKTYEGMSRHVYKYALEHHSVKIMTDNFLKQL